MTFALRFFRVFLGAALATTMLAGCSETQLLSHYAKKVSWPGQQKSVGTYKTGNPYVIDGTRYHPREDFRLVETGIASWYGPGFHGKQTANGERYDQNELTAAHRTLQMPSLVRVTNLENGRSIVVRVNDRGPFKKGRVIDVSKRSAELLGFISKGTARVRVEVLERESRQIAAAARQGLDTSRLTLADLRKYDAGASQMAAATSTPSAVLAAVPPRVSHPSPRRYESRATMARLENDAEMLPESLQTPTITVEELSAPGHRPPPVWVAPAPTPTPAPAAVAKKQPAAPAQGHMEQGRFMPDPVVTQQPVTPTGIFVQAGSFAVYDNADKLSKKLSHLAPVSVTPVQVNGRELYRVRLGPIATVERADAILEEVVRAGNETARVIRAP